jgi:hypothetical protein
LAESSSAPASSEANCTARSAASGSTGSHQIFGSPGDPSLAARPRSCSP